MANSMTASTERADWAATSSDRAGSIGQTGQAYPDDCAIMRSLAALHTRVGELMDEDAGDTKILSVVQAEVHSEEVAAEIIDNARREREHGHPLAWRRQQLAGRLDAALYQRGKRQAGSGFLWAIFGTAVTVITYAMAEPGGIFFIMWGAIVFGLLDVLKGFFGMATHSPNGRHQC